MMRSLYLDHAATTPCRPEVMDAMAPFFTAAFGNPNSLHKYGREARLAVDAARARIAASLGSSSANVVFTSGGSEAANLAILGAVEGARRAGSRAHVVTSQAEHATVLSACKMLEARGDAVTYLPVDEFGCVSADQVAEAVSKDTVLVSLTHANNEVGSVQPIAAIAGILKTHGPDVLFHVDGVQTVGQIPVDFRALGADLLSFTAHKFYGPKGIGALVSRPEVRVAPQIVGGGQEHGVRSGTEPVPLIVGMATALELAAAECGTENKSWSAIRDMVIREVLATIPSTCLTGHPRARLPTSASFCFQGITGEDLVLRLDQLGVCASTGSACTTGSLEPSHVLLAMGIPTDWAMGSLRLSFGRASRSVDVNNLVSNIATAVGDLRRTVGPPAARQPESFASVFL